MRAAKAWDERYANAAPLKECSTHILAETETEAKS